MPAAPVLRKEKIVEKLCGRLAKGESLVAICRAKDMPTARTIQLWSNGDDEIALAIRSAREVGFHLRAEKAVIAAKTAKDPIAGRLAFDAERWYLGKLSNAFADKPIASVAVLNVGGDDAFAAIAGALDRAAASIASSGTSTRAVVIEGEARPADAAGHLADLAGAGGAGLGQDAHGG